MVKAKCNGLMVQYIKDSGALTRQVMKESSITQTVTFMKEVGETTIQADMVS